MDYEFKKNATRSSSISRTLHIGIPYLFLTTECLMFTTISVYRSKNSSYDRTCLQEIRWRNWNRKRRFDSGIHPFLTLGCRY